MAKYPYLPNAGSLKKFIADIQTTGVPTKVTQADLMSRGFKSNNDRPIITVLKFINFLDVSGTPTENWIKFRNKEQGKGVIASCIKTAYSELFNLYPNAHEKDTEALRNFFSTAVTGGEQVLSQTVNTFRALCEFGQFGGVSIPSEVPDKAPQGNAKIASTLLGAGILDRQLVINLNIQLQLPATDNAEIYDKIFQSLKKNVLGT